MDLLSFENVVPKSPEAVEIDAIRQSVAKDYELNNPNSQRAVDEAATNNLLVVFPSDRELQLDLDTEHAFNIYQEMLPLFNKYFGLVQVEVRPSRSGLPKRHVTLTTYEPLTNYQRIAIQLALGSDRVREMLSIVQEHLKDPHPTLFLENKDTPAV